MITILNTSILTNYGCYGYDSATLQEVRDLISGSEWQSAVGHASTAEILTELLGVEVPVNRMVYSQAVCEKAIVFKLKGRPQEGKILSRDEIEEIGYEFGILERVS